MLEPSRTRNQPSVEPNLSNRILIWALRVAGAIIVVMTAYLYLHPVHPELEVPGKGWSYLLYGSLGLSNVLAGARSTQVRRVQLVLSLLAVYSAIAWIMAS